MGSEATAVTLCRSEQNRPHCCVYAWHRGLALWPAVPQPPPGILESHRVPGHVCVRLHAGRHRVLIFTGFCWSSRVQANPGRSQFALAPLASRPACFPFCWPQQPTVTSGPPPKAKVAAFQVPLPQLPLTHPLFLRTPLLLPKAMAVFRTFYFTSECAGSYVSQNHLCFHEKDLHVILKFPSLVHVVIFFMTNFFW